MEFGYAFDHVAYGFDGAEGFVGDVDVEGLFDLEGDVDLVEGVDVQLLEGAGVARLDVTCSPKQKRTSGAKAPLRREH